ncbi:MAG: HD-GYP domain-containing protein [Bacillota bacterium]
MKFNIKQFFISISFLLDFIEIDILDEISNHGRRVAYIATKIGEHYKLSNKELFILMGFAILHDIGGVKNKDNVSKIELEKKKDHCIIGENTINIFPIFSDYENIILYHHENYDGSGFFGKSKEEIPLFSQIISLADFFELNYKPNIKKSGLINKIKQQKNKKFSPELIDIICSLTKHETFWLNLQDEFILNAIKSETPDFYKDYSYNRLESLTAIFSEITDSKSKYTKNHSTELSEKIRIMSDYYKFEEEKKYKLMIAANLHDIGKLAISNEILDKPTKLTYEEYEEIKAHSFYTRKVLEPIENFSDIKEWASNHHEKNDGSGYPYGFTKKQLDFPSQIMAALDIYEALRENRPYRKAYNHQDSVQILYQMVSENKLNKKVVKDIDNLFS